MQVLLTIGTPGLTKPDFNFRWYVDGVPDTSGVVSGLALTEIPDSDGDYTLDNVPETVAGVAHVLTWEFPEGVGGYDVGLDDGHAPVSLILPVKDSTLTDPVTELSLVVYKDGAVHSSTNDLTAGEIGSTGDYLVSGWPTDVSGTWTLRWRTSGISFRYDWRVAVTVSAYYFQILAVQEPFAIGYDVNNRNMFSVNFRGKASGTLSELEDDVIAILEDAGLVVPNVTVIIGPRKTIPDGDGPYVLVKSTGGVGPDETHDGVKTRNFSFQVTVYAKSYTAGRTKANAIWQTLDGRRNFAIAA